MSIIFLLGLEEDMVVQKANFEMNIDGYTSEPILYDEDKQETTAHEYLVDALIVERRIKPVCITSADGLRDEHRVPYWGWNPRVLPDVVAK
ncbi:hypothetical protein JZ785_20235 [Alicyclobacillus curvatus]|nr:hypothetical protein JZ785_20235 [Alicyclobacillus curvatus]